jgi:hypothetical protein
MSSEIAGGAGLATSAGTLTHLAASILVTILIGASGDMGLHALASGPLLTYQSIGILAVLCGPSIAAQRAMPMLLLYPLHQVGLSSTWLRLSGSLGFSRRIGVLARPAKAVR